MKKAEGIRWSSLEGDDEVKLQAFPTDGMSSGFLLGLVQTIALVF